MDNIDINDFDAETDVIAMFVSERNSVNTQQDLNDFKKRWGVICIEMQGEYNINEFLEIRDNIEKQNLAVKDHSKQGLLDLILPRTLLKISGIATHYQVPTGCALLQLLEFRKSKLSENHNINHPNPLQPQ